MPQMDVIRARHIKYTNKDTGREVDMVEIVAYDPGSLKTDADGDVRGFEVVTLTGPKTIWEKIRTVPGKYEVTLDIAMVMGKAAVKLGDMKYLNGAGSNK